MDYKSQPITRNIAKKGGVGTQSSLPASSSLNLDNKLVRKPFLAILPPLACI